MLILCWALHRKHISIDPALVNQLESRQRTKWVQEDVAQQLCWWAKQVRRTRTTWESLYRHLRTDEVPSSSAPAPKLAAMPAVARPAVAPAAMAAPAAMTAMAAARPAVATAAMAAAAPLAVGGDGGDGSSTTGSG